MSNLNNYPVEAFPSKLRDVIETLHEDTLIPIEMIGSTALAALSLALQPLLEVASPYGNKKSEPCSLYFLTLAKSGEGKSPLRELLMAPFDEFASEMHEEYEKFLDVYKKDYAIWSSKEKALNRNYQKAVKNGGEGDVEELLLREHQAAEPKKPRAFEMFYEDATPEGIIQGLSEYPYAGVFADEAITFFTGQLKNNLGLLNKIWKNEPLSVSRKKEGNIRLNACLTFLLMVQPEVFEEYLERHGKKAISSGFLARFLFTETVSTIGQRRITLNQEKSRHALDALFEVIHKLLKAQKEHFYDTSKSKKALILTDDAKSLFAEKINQYQLHINQNQCWEHIPEFVSKAGSHAIRIAAMFEYDSDKNISEQSLKKAFTITEWYLNQAGKYFYKLSAQYQLQQDVYLLFDWIKNRFINPTGVMKTIHPQTGQAIDVKLQPWQPFSKNELETHGPARLRRVESLTPVLNQLIHLGLIVTISYPPQRALYIAMAGSDNYGNIYANRPFFTPFNLIDYKNNASSPLNGYDLARLQWQ
ncbi:YfjI family protein [Enterobacter cloacae]|uniref:YfjI family protein n=1 Tax=Enterobacter cloacae TaxID=550 RepID=UPI002FD5D7C7